MKAVKAYLENLLEPDITVVIACSGGPDSMCLLQLLLEQKSEKNLQIICAHVNHKMRLESEEEALFVKKYGYDLMEHLPALFWDRGEYKKIRKITLGRHTM